MKTGAVFELKSDRNELKNKTNKTMELKGDLGVLQK
jgi:hypothetical protein